MDIDGFISYYVNYLIRGRISFEGVSKDEFLDSLKNNRILRVPHNISEVRNKTIVFTNLLFECLNDLKREVREEYQEKETVKIFDATYFYSETLGVKRSTFSQWRKKDFFQNEHGTEKKQKVTIDEIENFLNQKRFVKYRKYWENRK